MEVILTILKIYAITRVYNVIVMHTYLKGLLKEIKQDYIVNVEDSLLLPIRYDIFIPLYSELKIFNRLRYKEEYKFNLILYLLSINYISKKSEYEKLYRDYQINIDDNYNNIDKKKENNIDDYKNINNSIEKSKVKKKIKKK